MAAASIAKRISFLNTAQILLPPTHTYTRLVLEPSMIPGLHIAIGLGNPPDGAADAILMGPGDSIPITPGMPVWALAADTTELQPTVLNGLLHYGDAPSFGDAQVRFWAGRDGDSLPNFGPRYFPGQCLHRMNNQGVGNYPLLDSDKFLRFAGLPLTLDLLLEGPADEVNANADLPLELVVEQWSLSSYPMYQTYLFPGAFGTARVRIPLACNYVESIPTSSERWRVFIRVPSGSALSHNWKVLGQILYGSLDPITDYAIRGSIPAPIANTSRIVRHGIILPRSAESLEFAVQNEDPAAAFRYNVHSYIPTADGGPKAVYLNKIDAAAASTALSGGANFRNCGRLFFLAGQFIANPTLSSLVNFSFR